MVIRLGIYRRNVDFIKSVLKRDDEQTEITKLISLMSISTNVPAIVVAYYVGEIQGFSPTINEMIEKLNKFYNYERIEE